MCPKNQKWMRGRPCPRADQPDVMPGPWYFKDLEPESRNPPQKLYIRDYWESDLLGDHFVTGDPDELLIRSNLYYSCEEFPAARYVDMLDPRHRPGSLLLRIADVFVQFCRRGWRLW